MRYRGKTKDGKWVKGWYTETPNYKSLIIPLAASFCKIGEGYEYVLNPVREVIPSTISQGTGLKDKNGEEIYEGDILRKPPKDEWDKLNYVCYEVFFHDNDCAYSHIGFQMNRCHYHGNVCGGYVPNFLPKTTAKLEVIGNIHDNPKLLGRGQIK